MELDEVAGRELAGERQVGGDHVADLRIAARGLPIGHQQDRLAAAGTWIAPMPTGSEISSPSRARASGGP